MITDKITDLSKSKALSPLSKLNDKAIVMHPLPRVNEIPKEFDKDKRAKYFEQMRNGLWCRMALLEKIILN